MRDSIHRYFINIVNQVASRSTCLRRHVGAIAVKDKRILATGYNGSPSGTRHCEETGCLRQMLSVPSGQRHEICRAVHAEQNVIIQAAKHGISLEGAEIYCTTFPCNICAKMLVNCGLSVIYYLQDYIDPMAAEILDEAGVRYIRLYEEDL